MSTEQPIGLDPLDELHEDYQPDVTQPLSSLDGDVQSQGIRASHRDWLDMGSEGWQTTSDELKAAAFQAATLIGKWDVSRLKQMMLTCYGHLQPAMMDFAIETLEGLAKKHPLHVEEEPRKEAPQIVIRRRNQAASAEAADKDVVPTSDIEP